MTNSSRICFFDSKTEKLSCSILLCTGEVVIDQMDAFLLLDDHLKVKDDNMMPGLSLCCYFCQLVNVEVAGIYVHFFSPSVCQRKL